MTSNTLTLYRRDGIWVAQYEDTSIIEVLGTDTLPTAYRDTNPAYWVRAHVARRNPHLHVVVRENS